jgi:arylformamidase
MSPTEALRECLAQIFAKLPTAGVGPQNMIAVTFETATPEAFHPARHEVNLAWREGFAGWRAPIRMVPSSAPGLSVRIAFEAGASADPRLAKLAGEYSPRRQTDMTALFRRWSEEGAAFRTEHAGLDLAYGPSAFEALDLYRPPGAARAPLWVFVHGGYWQASDKAQHAQFAAGMLRAGFAVAMPNYGLAPDAPLETCVAHVVQSLVFLKREADQLGIDASRMHLAGHSAGAHLAAMAANAPEAPPVSSLLLLSGLFDLEPLGELPLGVLLGLDDAARAKALSPILRAPPSCPTAFAYGELESEAFADQSRRMAQRCGAEAPMVVAGAHHFNMLDALRDGGALLDAALDLAGGKPASSG